MFGWDVKKNFALQKVDKNERVAVIKSFFVL